MKFSEIYGQEAAKAAFVSGIRQGRIPHAQMFIGREGSSALALALAYARYASCLNRGESDSCDHCASCIKYKQLIHPDLHLSFPIFGSNETCDDFIARFRSAFLDNPILTLSDWLRAIEGENKKPNINIRECRSIIRKLSLKPYESEFKVLIMWLPEYLGKEGNVLLKLLEEPPHNTLFLLVTENQDAILTTIISRTQYTRLPSYPYEQIKTYLEEKQLASGELAHHAALMAEGSLSKGVQLAREMENPQFEDFRNWLLNCYQGNIDKILSDMDHYSDKGKEGLKMFLNYGVHLLRSSLISRHRQGDSTLSPAESEFVTKLARFIHIGNISDIYDAFNAAVFEIDRNGSVKLILINLSLKLKNCLRMPEAAPAV